MIELLSSPLMQRALIAAVLVGAAGPVIGTFLVQRRLALLGDGIGHIALTGVAAGWLVGAVVGLTPPDALALPGAMVVAVLGAVGIEWVRTKGRITGDVAMAILFYGGIAGGVLIIKIAGGTSANLMSYLFGSIATVSTTDVVWTAALAGRGARGRARPARGPVRGQPRRGVRPGQRAAGGAAHLDPRRARGPDRDRGDAGRRAAAGLRADDRAGRHGPGGRAVVRPHHGAGQRDRRERERGRAS